MSRYQILVCQSTKKIEIVKSYQYKNDIINASFKAVPNSWASTSCTRLDISSFHIFKLVSMCIDFVRHDHRFMCGYIDDLFNFDHHDVFNERPLNCVLVVTWQAMLSSWLHKGLLDVVDIGSNVGTRTLVWNSCKHRTSTSTKVFWHN